MPLLPSYLEFQNWEHADKVDFLDEFLQDNPLIESEKKNIKRLLMGIIQDEKNNYLKYKAIDIFCALTLSKIFEVETLLGILFDDLDNNEEYFIQIQRLKYLFLFDNGNPKNQDLINQLIHHTNADVASEAYFRKGLITFFQASYAIDSDFLTALRDAFTFFSHADEIVENRIDACYYRSVTDFLMAIISKDVPAMTKNLEKAAELLWRLELFSQGEYINSIEIPILISLQQLLYLFERLTDEDNWIDYSKEIQKVFEIHLELLATETQVELYRKTHFISFKDNINSYIINPLYKYNLLAAKSKIQIIATNEKNDTDYQVFLHDLVKRLDNSAEKKKEAPIDILMTLARHFPHISTENIKSDLLTTDNENPLSVAELVIRYENQSLDIGYKTGFHTGDEILHFLVDEIIIQLPSYPKTKLKSFIIALIEVIRYVERTMTEQKDFFPELYNPDLAKGKTERIFQQSLYNSLRNSRFAQYFQYEPNQIAAGRIDITFEDGILVFPIEIKKTTKLPTRTNIRKYYLEQAQTYTTAHDQLGIFVVFDLTPKTDHSSPINDIRDLFSLEHMRPLYQLEDKFPDYIVSVIVPGNKVSPSSKSTYK